MAKCSKKCLVRGVVAVFYDAFGKEGLDWTGGGKSTYLIWASSTQRPLYLRGGVNEQAVKDKAKEEQEWNGRKDQNRESDLKVPPLCQLHIASQALALPNYLTAAQHIHSMSPSSFRPSTEPSFTIFSLTTY